MEDTEATIIRLSKLISAAELRKDTDVISPCISDGYVGIDPSGEIINKAGIVNRYRRGDFNLTTLALSDIVVKTKSDTAWEFGIMNLSGSLGEKQFSSRYVYSHFWVMSGIDWLIEASQMTPLLR